MLTQFPIHPSVAVTDLDRTRAWYADKLSLTPEVDDPGGLWYRFGGDSWLHLYVSSFAGTAQNTVAGWSVKGIESVMSALRDRGVVFEDYDFGEIKTVDGLADFGAGTAAWFKDPDGNTFELSEVLAAG